MIKGTHPAEAIWVLEHLRDTDRRELTATMPSDNPVDLMDALGSLSAERLDAFTAVSQKGVPVAVFGVMWLWPGMGSIFAFGTPDWPEQAGRIFRFCKQFLIPAAIKRGMHRAECRVIADNGGAHRFLAGLGFHTECALPSFGKREEDFLLYARVEGRHAH